MKEKIERPSLAASPTGDEWLDIKAAAQLLRVSEISLRRWTDAGRLPCTRVGGRRERRFRRADLEAMLDTQPGSRTAASDPPRVASVALEDMQLTFGTHLCAFYQTAEGRLKLGVPFLVSGLRDGDACFVVASPTATRALREGLLDPALGGLQAQELDDLTLHPGSADPLVMLDWFHGAFMRESARGRKCRVLGDMACFLEAGASIDAVLAFESRYDQGLARQFAVLSLCQYDSRAFSGVEVVAALRCHADTFEYPLARFLGP